MGLWRIWLLGLAITIGTSILIHKKTKIDRILVDILVIVSIAIVGGIAEGWAIGFFYSVNMKEMTFTIIESIFVAIAIWHIGSLILGIFKKNQFRKNEIVSFILVFIFTSTFWSLQFINYNNNIKEIDEVVVIGNEKNELIFFENIPLQPIPENISGLILLLDSDDSSSIIKLEEVQYLYINRNGEVEYNSVPVNSSKIRFIKKNEKSYIEVITYRKQKRIVNNNNENVKTETESEWNEYIFYLPQPIRQYQVKYNESQSGALAKGI